MELLVSWFPHAVDKFCGNVELSDHYTSLTWLFGFKTTPVAALALGSGAVDPTGTRNWELPQPKLLCSAFPPWPPTLSCGVVQDVGWRRRREPWSTIVFRCCAEWKGRLVILHLVSVFWELGKLGKGERAGVELC